MKREQINQRIGERDKLYMRGAQELPEYEKGHGGFQDLKTWVKNQPWYKQATDRHYTKEHAYKRCTCTRPENWLFNVIEVK